jgi:hypothetical protein
MIRGRILVSDDMGENSVSITCLILPFPMFEKSPFNNSSVSGFPATKLVLA